MPPSTTSSEPVHIADCCDRKNITAPAMSSGITQRPSGTAAAKRSFAGPSITAWIRSVSTGPGQTVLTRMCHGASS